MKMSSKGAGACAVAVFCIGLAVSGIAWANGEEFFEASKDGSVDLVYFGHIRDQNGKVVDGATISILVGNDALQDTFPPFLNDTPGHYRSDDFGAWIKTRGWDPVPEQTQLVAEVEGYEKAVANVPKKVDGPIEVNFVMRKLGSAPVTAAAAEPGAGSRPWLLPTAVVGLLLLSVAVVRKVSRRRSTDYSGPASA